MVASAHRLAGRPRGFDRDIALGAALRLFWTHGYEGVSISHLTDAMGIAAPSLYAAFGSKEALFKEVLELYHQSPGSLASRAFMGEGPIRLQVSIFLRTIAKAFTDPGTPAGCMVLSGMTFCADDKKNIAELLAARRRLRIRDFSLRFQQAIDQGEIPDHMDAQVLGRYLHGLMQSMSIQARDGATELELLGLVELVERTWLAFD